MSNLLTKMALQVRPATIDDRPAIINLLRKSLGESTIPKSEALWIWKHEQNPFGDSLVLLAEDNGEVCGVRAFMQWQFHRRGKFYSALRAVDTVTHPDYMGRGIFKKLTLQLVETCKNEGYHFIFNTPNEQSKPGYLKMGWWEQGRMPLKFKFIHPVDIAYRKFFSHQLAENPAIHSGIFQKWTRDIYDLAKKVEYNHSRICTYITPEYLSWRYASNPLFNYNFITDEKNVLLISRIKQHPIGMELRITDFFLLNEKANPNEVNRFLKKWAASYCRENKIDFISCSGQQYKDHWKYMRWMGLVPVISAGPLITIRNLNMKSDFRRLINKKYWGYSTGDLELF